MARNGQTVSLKDRSFVLKGDILWSKDLRTLNSFAGGFLVCVEGKSAGVCSRLPEQYASLPLFDYSGCIIIPGLVDLHMHTPQFAFRSLGMDLELLDWLNTRAFPEEAKYQETEYARRAYGLLVEGLKQGPNTRLVLFATVHTPATLLLMDLLEESGLCCMAGKVNMDRNSPDNLREAGAAASLAATRKWLEECFSRNKQYRNTWPILTPRFIPSCSNELLRGLGGLQREYGLPIQSHLSENKKEMQWVRKLCPQSDGYGAAYQEAGLFGGNAPTVMAHCVWSDEKEISLMAKQGVFAAHCPQSNTNLSSGIAPVRRLLEAGVPVGLGSDIAGGAHSSIFRAMTDAIQVSKLRRFVKEADGSPDEKPLSLEEAFFLGTAGGGRFFERCGFGGTGSFEPGSDFDALVIDDTELAAPFELSLRDRLERVMYLSDDRHIRAKYARGQQFLFD